MALTITTNGSNIARCVFDTPPADGRDARKQIAAALAAEGKVITGAIGKPVHRSATATRYLVAWSAAK
jgi:hypothetical protein